MEGGNTSNISLESTLDVHSSEMLVPVSQPLFQHNRQRFQGKYLPNSLRFEHDGWAAGKDVYNFEVSEYAIAVGEYTVGKKLYAKYTGYSVYLITVYNSEGNKIGTIRFINRSSILSHTCDTCSITNTTSANPEITGTINGYEFKLNYDSIEHTLTLSDDSDSNISLQSFSLARSYTLTAYLEDLASYISLTFNGLYRPSSTAYNGSYSLGTFQGLSDGIATWSTGKSTVTFDITSNKFVWSYDNVDKITETLPAQTSNTYALDNYTVNVYFVDTPQVALSEFYAFFNNLQLSTLYTTISTQANSDYSFNNWNVTMYDPINTESNIATILYRNLPSYNDDSASDYNFQIIQQQLPVWAGISAQQASYSVKNLAIEVASGAAFFDTETVTLPSSDLVKYYFYTEENSSYKVSWTSTSESATAPIQATTQTIDITFKANDTLQKYSDYTHTFNIQIWEHCKDISTFDSDALSEKIKYKVTVTYTYYVATSFTHTSNSTSETDDEGNVTTIYTHTYTYNFTKQTGTVTFELDDTYGDISSLIGTWAVSYDTSTGTYSFPDEALDGLFDITANEYVQVTSVAFAYDITASDFIVTIGDSTCDVDISDSIFYLSGSMAATWTPSNDFHVTLTNNSLVFRSQISENNLGTGAKYLEKLKSSDDFDDKDGFGIGYAFYGRCCKGLIISALYIASNSLLTSSLTTSAFGIMTLAKLIDTFGGEAADYVEDYDKDALYINDYFTHKITQATCSSSLTISLYTCAVSSKTYAFYAGTSISSLNTDTSSSSSTTTTKYMPGHIVFGNIGSVSSSYGSLTYYTISKTYTSTTIDSDYALNLSITGTPAKDDDDNLFNYVSSIQSAYDSSNLLTGNQFSDEIATSMQSAISWSLTAIPKFLIQLDANESSDIGQLKYHYQTIECIIDSDTTIEYTYDLICNLFSYTSNTTSGAYKFMYEDYDLDIFVTITENDVDLDDASAVLNMSITYATIADYDITFAIPMLYADNSNWTLSAYNSVGVATLIYTDPDDSNKQYMLTVNYTSNTCLIQRSTDGGVTWGESSNALVTWGTDTAFTLSNTDVRTIVASLMGVYDVANITMNSVTSSLLSLTYGEDTIDVDISSSGLFDPEQQSSMDYFYTDVTDETSTETKFANALVDDEFQLVRQQWNTNVDVENYWWIDDTHILLLTKSQFILRQKASEIEDYTDVTLDDWNGDVFVDVASYARTSYLTSDVSRYFCTSAYDGASAKFITISISGDELTLNVYDPLNAMEHTYYTVQFVRQYIGSQLCPDNQALYTYSELVYYNVVSQGKWSGTCIDTHIIIGLHYDNNFNQWAIIIDSEASSFYIIQGYGFVGVNGCLTGGEIPTLYFDSLIGFTDTVQSLDILKTEESTSTDDIHLISDLSELYAVETRIVGTDAQQWYIIKELPSIVSHLTYSNGTFTVHELLLNNNYSVIYASGSYSISVFADYEFKVKSFTSVLPETNALFTTACALMGSPLLYYFNPNISVANYLQQTLGQAAYVHYNSTSIHQSKNATKESVTNNYSEEEATAAAAKGIKEIAVSADEVTFDIQSVKQKQVTSDPYSDVFTSLAAAAVSALDWGSEQLKVNAASNDPAAPSQGGGNKKFSTNFLQNLNSMTAADMTMQSISPVQTSEVSAIKTLDMFYSTCDRQQVQAGPGWVNHNFVAQCVAQSVTSVQAEYSQQKILFILGALSEYQLQIENKALESAYTALYAYMQSFSGSGVLFGGFVAGGNTTLAASMALGLACAALDVACNATRIGLELVPKIISALGGESLQTSVTSRLSKHKYDVEGKHKYGSKTECFMWPCFGISAAQQINNESVECVTQNKAWKLSMYTHTPRSVQGSSQPDFVTASKPSDAFDDDIAYFISMIKGKQQSVTLPDNMAYVLGAPSFLPEVDYKNENIGMSEPVFPTAPFQDYIIDETWQIGQTASVGMTTWISCKDTKIIDGEYSNCVISDDFCGIAAPYTAIEVKRGISMDYLRPYTVTPQVLALNVTGLNCCYEEKAYHAFDGYGYRVVNWCGAPGMNKEHQTWLYSFLVNDRLKRSNKMPQNEYLGNFVCEPVVAIQGDYNDKVYTMITQPGEGKGLQAGTIGEDKDVRRYSIPVFSEFVNTLPAAVKTISTVTLSVIDGVTSLTTNNRDLQTAYKAPTSVDFTIGKSTYRYTQEYICSLQMTSGVTTTQDLVPCLGLEFIGSTPYEAYFYSQETRQYYVYTGGTSIRVVELIERFRDVTGGYYDFVNQEVLMPCLATFMRLDKHVFDDEDETDNVIVPRLKNSQFIGEVWPPLETIYNTRSWYKVVSLPCGIVYQGPNRCIVNRFTLQDYMVQQIKDNYGLWQRVPRERYHPFRTYKDKYEVVNEQIGDTVEVKGWTHNPFLLVTAPIGTSENTDNMYEWQITFCWPVEMDKLYDQDNYAVVNIQAETMTPGGKVVAERPTHVFLTKELFTRTGNYGYYSFRYQSLCGAGNRERLHIWSDQFICISSLDVNIKQITNKRTEQLTIQVDVQHLTEI